jgi:glycerol uptake facilitator-like aquaporin
MTRDRIAAIGFQHPIRSRRPLTPRNVAFAELIMTFALVVSIVVAATAVGIGIARADVAGRFVADGAAGTIGIAIFLGLLIAGMGGITAAVTRHMGEKPQAD